MFYLPPGKNGDTNPKIKKKFQQKIDQKKRTGDIVDLFSINLFELMNQNKNLDVDDVDHAGNIIYFEIKKS